MYQKNVLVIGSTCVDVIIRVDHLPRTQENLHPDSQRFAIGGCAYNVANILGRAGAPVTFVTPVGGRGVFGGFVRERLDALRFASPVLLPDQENGCCYCFVERGGERTFLSIHGAEYTFDPAWMAPYAGKRYAYGYVCGLEVEEKTGGLLIDYLQSAPIDTLLYAPGPRGARVAPALTQKLFALHPILHLNEDEARALGGCGALDDAMRALYGRTGNTVIVTLGADGVRCLENGGLFTVPGVRAEHVADTIGAGDAHAGTTLLGLCRNMPLAQALALANRVCARVVQTDGATLGDADFAQLFSPRQG